MIRSIVAGFDQVHDVGPAFVHFEHFVAGDAGGVQRRGGAARGDQFESQGDKFLASGTMWRLSRSFTLRKIVPLRGRLCPAASCALANASPKDVRDAHHFAGGAHLRAEDGVHAAEFVEREYRRFHGVDNRARRVRRRRRDPRAADSCRPVCGRPSGAPPLWPAARPWPC